MVRCVRRNQRAAAWTEKLGVTSGGKLDFPAKHVCDLFVGMLVNGYDGSGREFDFPECDCAPVRVSPGDSCE